MPKNVTNELLYEVLKSIQAGLAANTKAVETLTLRVGSLEDHVAGMRRDIALLHTDLALTHKRIDDGDQRLGRIEHRLEMVG